MKRLRTPILMYHHVEPKPFEPRPRFSSSYVSRAEFSDHLDWLADKNFEVLSLTDALARADRGEPAARTAVLTFDDGCKCFLEHSVPELERRSMNATVFVVSGRLGADNAWDVTRGERTETLLSSEELQDLERRGFEIASHSRSHADLTGIRGEELALEAAGSKRDLDGVLQRPVETFCYPYGHFDSAAKLAVREAGYRAAVSVYGMAGVSAADPMALPRAVVRPGNSRLEFKLQATGWYGLWRRLPRLGILSQLRGTRRGS